MADPLVRKIWRSTVFLLPGILLILTFVLLPLSALGSSDADLVWQTIQQGLDYARIDLITKAEYGDNRLHCVRIDPGISRLTAILASQNDGKRDTAGGWCREKHLATGSLLSATSGRMTHKQRRGKGHVECVKM